MLQGSYLYTVILSRRASKRAKRTEPTELFRFGNAFRIASISTSTSTSTSSRLSILIPQILPLLSHLLSSSRLMALAAKIYDFCTELYDSSRESPRYKNCPPKTFDTYHYAAIKYFFCLALHWETLNFLIIQ